MLIMRIRGVAKDRETTGTESETARDCPSVAQDDRKTAREDPEGAQDCLCRGPKAAQEARSPEQASKGAKNTPI